MLGRTTVFFAVTAALAVISAACTSNPTPKPLADPGPSPAPSASASPTVSPAPTLPSDATGTSPAAAKAFVRHYIDVLNHAGPSGDTSSLRQLHVKACSACVRIADFIDAVDDRDGSIKGDGWMIRSISVVQHDGRRAVLDVIVKVNEQVVHESAAAEPARFEGAERRSKTFWLTRGGGKQTWAVKRLEQPE